MLVRFSKSVLPIGLVLALLAATTVGAAAAGWSVGDTSGNMYAQSYARFPMTAFTLDTSGGAGSCHNGNHINQTMWLSTKATQPIPRGQTGSPSWLEVGFMGGINLSAPMNPDGCDIGFYYENHPTGSVGTWVRRVPMGVNGQGVDYWIRFNTSGIGSIGAYVIINGTGYESFSDQWCCGDDIEVGLEATTPAAPWSASTTHDTGEAYYDLNWVLHNWDGCTIGNPAMPNNCSTQLGGLRGAWQTPWTDYWNAFP